MTSNAMLIPFSGIVLLCAGFSALGFAFAGVNADNGYSNTNAVSIVYYTSNGLGILCSIMAAVPIQVRIRKREAEMALSNTIVAIVFYIIATVFGIIGNYNAYENKMPNGGSLYFMSWITAICGMLANGALCSFSLLALYPPPKCPDQAPHLCPDLEMAEDTDKPPAASTYKKKIAKSRSEMRS